MQPPTIRPLAAPLVLLLLAFAGVAMATLAASPGSEAAKPNRYIGAAKCKNCHSYEAAGDQYTAWTEMKHAMAWDVLGTEEARKVAAELGIDDPQKSDRCLKCHTTGHGQPEEMFKKGFDLEKGVQCETCHGPGELHMKARFAAAAMDESEDEGDDVPAYVQIPEDELAVRPSMETCLGCHNDESPSFKAFCFYERIQDVRHLDPRKPRSQAELDDLLVCGCGDTCGCVHGCAEGECGIKASEKAARDAAGG